jgi:hypothetical protein
LLVLGWVDRRERVGQGAWREECGSTFQQDSAFNLIASQTVVTRDRGYNVWSSPPPKTWLKLTKNGQTSLARRAPFGSPLKSEKLNEL